MNIGTAPLLVQACQGIRGKHAPVWFMRQAGRYLPEYRALRAKHNMLELITTPELACEVTLQPLRRFSLDAAIIFADILTPLISMGVDLEFVEGLGPRILNPIRTPDDVLALLDAVRPGQFTIDAIATTLPTLNRMGVPLIGFAGAPFTLSAYLIEGQGSQTLREVKRFMGTFPEAWVSLQERLVAMLTEYLCAQAEAGAAVLQIFDSWLGYLGPCQYKQFVEPYLKKLIKAVRERTNRPVVFFSTGTASLLPAFGDLAFDVLGVDWRVQLPEAARSSGVSVIQGNLDPTTLFASKSYIEREVRRILEEGQELQAHIFNLGHGLLPETPPENLAYVVELVKS